MAAELSAMRLVAELADLLVLLLIHLSAVIPPDSEQTRVLELPLDLILVWILYSLVIFSGVPLLDYLLAPNLLSRSCIPGIQLYLDAC